MVAPCVEMRASIHSAGQLISPQMVRACLASNRSRRWSLMTSSASTQHALIFAGPSTEPAVQHMHLE